MSLNAKEGETMTPFDNCEKHARIWMYIAWGITGLVLIPIQYLIVSIFKAYRDEIKEDESEYEQLPSLDQEFQA